MIVEHDVSFTIDQYNEIANCPKPWCGAMTPYFQGQYPGMGLVKFDAAMMELAPDALDQVGELFDKTHAKKHWCRLDHWLQRRVLPSYGFEKHIHDMVIGHSHLEPSHGCHKG